MRSPARTRTAFLIMCHCEASAHTGCGNPQPPSPWPPCLLTQYEKTFDLATVKRVAEEAGMKKPTSGQVEYLELPSSDSAVVYRGDAGTALENIVDSIAAAVSSVVEYFR